MIQANKIILDLLFMAFGLIGICKFHQIIFGFELLDL